MFQDRGPDAYGTHFRSAGGNRLIETVRRLWIEDEGQDLSEYALILLLVSLVVVAALGAFESHILSLYATSSARVVAIAHHEGISSHLYQSSGPTFGAHLSGNTLNGINMDKPSYTTKH